MSKSLENLTDEELMSYETDEDFAPQAEEPVSESVEENEVMEVEVSAPEEASVETEEESVSDGSQEEVYDDDHSDEDHTTPVQIKAKEPEQEVDKQKSVNKTDPMSNEKGEVAEKSATDSKDDFNYKAAYEQLMVPFKANGKEFKPESPEEVIRLAQQGANYVKKMTALKPNLRMMRMLENNGLLDEEKINFLIDLTSGNQEAVKKFLKDQSVDPMDIDIDEESKYQPGNHKVTDQELTFSDTLQDVMSTEGGPRTVQIIQNQWDDRSKEAVYQDPSILSLINEQRRNGIYDRIAVEMDRRKTLGILTDSTPFLEAYRNIGDELHQAGRLIPQEQARTAPAQSTQPRQPVASRPGHSRTVSAPNAAAARAASPARTSPKQPRPEFDPLSMTDEEIMAMASPRI